MKNTGKFKENDILYSQSITSLYSLSLVAQKCKGPLNINYNIQGVEIPKIDHHYTLDMEIVTLS